MKKQGSNSPESTIKVKDVYERIIDIYGLYDYGESWDMHTEINKFLDELEKKYERDTNKKL